MSICIHVQLHKWCALPQSAYLLKFLFTVMSFLVTKKRLFVRNIDKSLRVDFKRKCISNCAPLQYYRLLCEYDMVYQVQYLKYD